MHRFARKEYTDKAYRYRLQTQRARTPPAQELYSRHPYDRVSIVCGCVGSKALAWWVCRNVQLKEGAPRCSKADVYDRELR